MASTSWPDRGLSLPEDDDWSQIANEVLFSNQESDFGHLWTGIEPIGNNVSPPPSPGNPFVKTWEPDGANIKPIRGSFLEKMARKSSKIPFFKTVIILIKLLFSRSTRDQKRRGGPV